MLLNDGTYKGKQVLSPASVKTMLGREWIYDDKTKNGNNYGGTILSYGLGIYQMDGKSTARFCKDTLKKTKMHAAPVNSATTTFGQKPLAMLFAVMCLSADKTEYLLL
ncbi:hypothetical protein [Selenomonas ruminantium]|uniref:hypothetical protein n=1 Tax=Selenomonas ruminantium TaxID=971 RepID=UPI0026EE3BCA|nr:hypothetical protein [Selenomonas ruminantium]